MRKRSFEPYYAQKKRQGNHCVVNYFNIQSVWIIAVKFITNQFMGQEIVGN